MTASLQKPVYKMFLMKNPGLHALVVAVSSFISVVGCSVAGEIVAIPHCTAGNTFDDTVDDRCEAQFADSNAWTCPVVPVATGIQCVPLVPAKNRVVCCRVR